MSQDLPRAPSPREMRALRVAALASVLAHFAARGVLLAQGRFFASEDDPYRAYISHLVSIGPRTLVGHFWLPGQFVALAGLERLGLDAATAPLVLGAIAMGLTLLALASLARDLAPPGWSAAAAWGTVALAALSPLELVLCHSALAEPLANALLALSAAALVRRHAGGARWLPAAGGAAMLLATWVRYEAWAFAALYPVATFALARSRRGDGGSDGASSPVREALFASIGLVGPLVWCAAQAATYGSPFAFLRTVDEMSAALAGAPSRSRVLELRFGALALWAPAALAGSVAATLAFWRAKSTLRPLALLASVGAPGLLLQIASGKGLGVFVLRGREVDFFSPRLVSNVEIGLLPLAGLGLAAVAVREGFRARMLLVAGAALVIGALAAGVRRPVEFVDPSSVRVGLLLRRGELDQLVGSGALLVEREAPRPPMGWSSVGVLWGQWSRLVWATPRGAGWQLVEPRDVQNARADVPQEQLAQWMDRRGVTAAWVLSPIARERLRSAWPGARLTPIGAGLLLSR